MIVLNSPGGRARAQVRETFPGSVRLEVGERRRVSTPITGSVATDSWVSGRLLTGEWQCETFVAIPAGTFTMGSPLGELAR